MSKKNNQADKTARVEASKDLEHAREAVDELVSRTTFKPGEPAEVHDVRCSFLSTTPYLSDPRCTLDEGHVGPHAIKPLASSRQWTDEQLAAQRRIKDPADDINDLEDHAGDCYHGDPDEPPPRATPVRVVEFGDVDFDELRRKILSEASGPAIPGTTVPLSAVQTAVVTLLERAWGLDHMWRCFRSKTIVDQKARDDCNANEAAIRAMSIAQAKDIERAGRLERGIAFARDELQEFKQHTGANLRTAASDAAAAQRKVEDLRETTNREFHRHSERLRHLEDKPCSTNMLERIETLEDQLEELTLPPELNTKLESEVRNVKALVERYQRCALKLWSMFESDPLPADHPAQGWCARLEALIELQLVFPTHPPTGRLLQACADVDAELTRAGYDDDDGEGGQLSLASRVRNLIFDANEERRFGKARAAAIESLKTRASTLTTERDEMLAAVRAFHEEMPGKTLVEVVEAVAEKARFVDMITDQVTTALKVAGFTADDVAKAFGGKAGL